MGTKQCQYVSVLEIAQYLCREIQTNQRSGYVKEIRSLLSLKSSKEKASKGFASIITLAPRILLPKPIRLLSSTIAVSGEIATRRIRAYRKWQELVAAGRIWDHKKAIQRLQGDQHWSCDKERHILFFYDLWSNIHYGFIGKAAGFSEWELTSGAGVAQLQDNTRTLKSWTTQYFQNRVRTIGDADFLSAFDDASDNEAIKIGFRLYDRFGGTPSTLTAQAIIDEIYKSYQNNRLVNIKICPNH